MYLEYHWICVEYTCFVLMKSDVREPKEVSATIARRELRLVRVDSYVFSFEDKGGVLLLFFTSFRV